VKNRFQSLPFKMQPAALHHGPEHPAADTSAFRRGFGPDIDVPVIGFFANGGAVQVEVYKLE
jgi:hypothetical protein